MTGLFKDVGMTEDAAKALREPFPEDCIGSLPKAGQHLDYVGHAVVTDRLLKVDPSWTWEPCAVDEYGNPKLDAEKNLWIRLTVCGVTRLGVGDGPDMKQRVSDALRNGAMRFGVALDLWAGKNALESEVEAAQEVERRRRDPDADARANGWPSEAERKQAHDGLIQRIRKLPEVERARFRERAKGFPLPLAEWEDLSNEVDEQAEAELTGLGPDAVEELTK